MKDPPDHSVKKLLKVLKVSEAGYYKWLKLQDRPYKYDDLLAKIREIRAENPDYGAHRIYLELKLFHSYTRSYYLVLKLCKENNVMLKKRFHAKGITKADPAAQASENLIQQDFTASSPNKKWLGDITEIPTADGKLYLAGVLDCFDGAIVGLKMANHMREQSFVSMPSFRQLRSIKHLECCFIVIGAASTPARLTVKRWLDMVQYRA